MDVVRNPVGRLLQCVCGLLILAQPSGLLGQEQTFGPAIALDASTRAGFPIFDGDEMTPICVAPSDLAPVRQAVATFRSDVQKLSAAVKPTLPRESCSRGKLLIIVGSLGHSDLLDELDKAKLLDLSVLRNQWESALVQRVDRPWPGVQSALVIAGSDARGAAFALFDMSRAMGVSPWNWWADVPVVRHDSAYVTQMRYLQAPPAVQYRGIFLNDEDWGLRPWAARTMDPGLKNIGPNTYTRIFELLLRLHANTLWPAMHPGSMPFDAVAENIRLAAQWGIVMGSSHSEAMLRNNVGEWDEGRDGPWNYQTNRLAIDRYWDERAKANGRFDNIYTVGMRGQHDSGLEATGSPEVKARLVEQVIADQREILARRVNPNLREVPQVIWLYKESIDLYRTGMKIPEDVTLGWTDDNYGYLRQLPTRAEQQRSGGSALYYHLSYWGSPHDYLWLATTPPALMREELTKAWDHGVKKMWIVNVGDIKPGEQEIDYFMQLAWRLPEFRDTAQLFFQQHWFAENFPAAFANRMAALQQQYYQLNFIRKPEFMGFNGYTDEVRRTSFNPLAWGDQNRQRLTAWSTLAEQTKALAEELPLEYQNAYFELLQYPVEASAAQNRKFLWTDRSYVDQHARDFTAVGQDAQQVESAFNTIVALTAQYNDLADGKWNSMMSWHPRDRRVFELPETALGLATAPVQLPDTWTSGTAARSVTFIGFGEQNHTISIDATHFSAKTEGGTQQWQVWPDLGLSNGSVGIAQPGITEIADWLLPPGSSQQGAIARSPSLSYDFTVTEGGDATVTVALLPTFPVDSTHSLRYALCLDDAAPIVLNSAGSEHPPVNLTDWSSNVLRNAALQTVHLGGMAPGMHELRLIYGDPGVIFQHLTISFPGAPPAYPFPPETASAAFR